MNITVFGANGRIGQLLLRQALQDGYAVTGFVRRPDALTWQHERLRVIVGTYEDPDSVAEAVQAGDVIFSTLGPALSMKREVKDLPIARAHEAIMRAMEKVGKRRFITLATPTVRAKEDKKQLVTVLPEIMAKLLYPTGYQEMKVIETLIHSSSLDWTVVRIVNPNVQSNGAGYAVSFGDTKGKMTVSRWNVARCMLDATSRNDWIHKMPIVFNR
ncbi:MAG: NAD(P)H-binding protein [Firmicutes bacterium]|nr:NAD(P)H-binding protein [Bacillota bacterium]